MLLGEYHGMLEIFKCYPSLVPRPYGCGQFLRGGVPTYFLVTDYIEMSDTLPDPCELAKSLANLHRTTISPSGRFGFHTTTWHGKVPQRVQWDSSWVSFFRELLDYALQKDLENSGSWPALEEIASTVLDKVVPRLLGVLESNGRSIRPALIHGDLWEGNIATERGTNRILLIDAAAYYAHCEMEIGMWRCQRHAIHDARFTNAYLEQVPKDEPVDEWDDRNRLYCIKMNLVHSAHHKGAVERKTYDTLPRRSRLRLTSSEVLSKICATWLINMLHYLRECCCRRIYPRYFPRRWRLPSFIECRQRVDQGQCSEISGILYIITTVYQEEA